MYDNISRGGSSSTAVRFWTKICHKAIVYRSYEVSLNPSLVVTSVDNCSDSFFRALYYLCPKDMYPPLKKVLFSLPCRAKR